MSATQPKTWTLIKGNVVGEYTVAKFTKDNPLSNAVPPMSLRQKTLEDEEADMAESKLVDKVDKNPQPEVFLSEKEKEIKQRQEENATAQRKKRLQKKQEFLLEDSSGKCRFESQPENTGYKYALFYTGPNNTFKMIPVVDQWLRFSPKIASAIPQLNLEEAEKLMAKREKNISENPLMIKMSNHIDNNEGTNSAAVTTTGKGGRKKIKEEKEDIDFTDEFADDEDDFNAPKPEEAESSDDEEEMANNLLRDDDDESTKKLSSEGLALKKLLRKGEDSDDEDEKKEEKKPEPSAVEPSKVKKEKSTEKEVKPAEPSAPEKVKREKKKKDKTSPSAESKSKKRKEAPDAASSEKKAKKMKKTETPDVPDHLLKDEVLRVLREREKISTKEIISMFMTNIKREKEEKDKRYAHFAAILKEVAVVEEVNKERWVKLKK